jgi:hypothetical protein
MAKRKIKAPEADKLAAELPTEATSARDVMSKERKKETTGTDHWEERWKKRP